MKKIFFICLWLQSNIFLAQNFMWAKRFAANNSIVYVEDMATDQAGNVITTGSFNGYPDFDPGAGTSVISTSSNDYEIFVSKLNLAGNFQWVYKCGTYTGTGNSSGNSVCTDAAGNVYVTGYFNNTVNFAFPYNVPSNMLTSSGNSDVFVLKIDPNGKFVWARNMGGLSADVGTSIVVDALGNVYTTGYFSGTVDFDPGPATYTLSSTGGTDIFVSKLDAAGNFVWAKTIGGLGMDRGTALSIDPSMNLVIGGFFNSTVDFDPGSAVATVSATSSWDDAFFMKLDGNGNFLWVNQIGGPLKDRINALTTDPSGNIYVSGGFDGVADFDPSSASYTLTTFGSTDVFVSKYSGSGNHIWTSQIGGGYGSEEALDIAVNSFGDVYTIGSCAPVSDFDPGVGTYTLQSSLQDIFVSRLNASGNFVAAHVIGGTGPELGKCLIVDPFDDITFSGYFPYGTGLDLDPGPGTYSLPPLGSDGWVVKLSDCTLSATIGASPSGTAVCTGQTLTLIASGGVSYTLYPGMTTGASQVFTPTLSTTYALVGSNSANCKDVVTFSVNVLPEPNVTVTPSNALPCVGETVTLTASAALSYTWNGVSNGSSTTVTLNVPTNSYVIAATNSLGCNSSRIYTISAMPSPTITLPNGSMCFGETFTIQPSGASTYTFSGGTPIVSPSVSTVYSVTGSDSGCTSANSATMLLTVNPLPTLVITGNNDICSGSSITQFVNGTALTYTWSDGTQGNVASLTPSITTVYSVVGTDMNNCTNSASKTITVHALPVLSVTGSSPVICIGETSTLSVSEASSYTWSNGSSASFIIHTSTLSTTYSVSGTDQNGCTNAVLYTQVVDACAGIGHLHPQDDSIKIFPNPTDGKLILHAEALSEAGRVEIYNSLNQVIFSSVMDSDTLELDIRDHPSGIYFVHVYKNDGRVIKEKVVKM